MTSRANIQTARDILATIEAIKGANYANVVRYHSMLNLVAKVGRDKVAVDTMNKMLNDLAVNYGIDMASPDYSADLSAVSKQVGVKS